MVSPASFLTTNKSIFKSLRYDPEADFVPINKFVNQPMVQVVKDKQKFPTLAAVLNAAKAALGKLTYASSGDGSPQNPAGLMFTTCTQTNLLHVPHKGVHPPSTMRWRHGGHALKRATWLVAGACGGHGEPKRIRNIYVPHILRPMGIVKISDQMHENLRVASNALSRSINAQAEHWMRIGMLAELHPNLDHREICQLLIRAERAGGFDLATVTTSLAEQPGSLARRRVQ